MSELAFHVLGPLEVTRDDRPIPLGGPLQRRLLALLLLNAGRVVSVDALMDALWGERPPETAVKTIHKYVSELRKVLGGPSPIETRGGGYVAAIDPLTLDAGRLEHLVARAEEIGDGKMLDEALTLWRGDPWQELEDHQAAAAERARLEERRLGALEKLIDLELDLGHHERMLPRLEELVITYPFRERFWARLMLALYRSGRQAEALDAYRRVHAALVDQLGIEPSPEVRELEARILAQDPDLLAAASQSAPRGPSVAADAGLPAQLTRFVGRRRELTQVARLLEGARLLTLTGVGGCGKTRLSFELVRTSRASYPDGTWFVALEALEDPQLLPQAVAAALGVHEQHSSPLSDTIIDVLRDARGLVILDNCEHLLEACAATADILLRRCPEMTILATSRERLGVAGETIYNVPPMPVPQTAGLPVESLLQHDSIELFVDRASAALPAFELTDENKDQVARLCMRLDGIPLALELAAGRVASLDLEEIARRLEGRLDLLGDGSRVAPPRQHTLSATIDWSYALLGEGERELFLRLTVFAGGFDIEAVEAICSGNGLEPTEVLALLLELVDKSLVVRSHPERTPARYRMLEPIRSYGREKLGTRGDADKWRERHALYFAALADESELELKGPNQPVWFQRLAVEFDNIRAALEWARKRPEITLRMMTSLQRLWDARGHPSEALQWIESALKASKHVDDRLRAQASVDAAWYALGLGRADRAEELARAGLETFRALEDESGTAQATHALGWVAQHRGAYEQAEKLLSESVARHRELGDDWQTSSALHHLGMVIRLRGDYAEAERLEQESLVLARDTGDRLRVGYV
ncbi:MAG: BTAD domain-containing putative transcriptional regulator, partial [Actinomycetota bacterium]